MMSTINKTPVLQTRNFNSILFNCAAFAVSVVFAGGMCLVMR